MLNRFLQELKVIYLKNLEPGKAAIAVLNGSEKEQARVADLNRNAPGTCGAAALDSLSAKKGTPKNGPGKRT